MLRKRERNTSGEKIMIGNKKIVGENKIKERQIDITNIQK